LREVSTTASSGRTEPREVVDPAGFVRCVIPVLILGVPLFDTRLVVLARLLGRRPVLLGSTDHASHRLAALGLPAGRVALTAYAAQACLTAISLWMIGASPAAVVLAAAGLGVVASAGMLALLRVNPMPRARNLAAIRGLNRAS
jgi:UDP-GlcNAc:undecaprenyl-phosphate GlcNAc-1-phosphate transferase